MSRLATLAVMKRHTPSSVLQVLRAVCALLVAALAGCATPHQIAASGAGLEGVAFKPREKASTAALISKDDLVLLEQSTHPVYVISDPARTTNYGSRTAT